MVAPVNLLIIGCGYVGGALAPMAAAQGWTVWGLARNAAVLTEWRAAGRAMIEADVTRPETLRPLRERPFDAVVYCVAAGRGADAEQAYRRAYQDGLAHVAEALHPDTGQLVFTSSTSVYPQEDGSALDEDAPTPVTSARQSSLLEGERICRSTGRGTVLRLAGIYGPGRGILLRKFLDGTAVIDGGGVRWLNLVHRDDIAGAVLACLKADTADRVLNVCDDEPVRLEEFYLWLSDVTGRPLPPHDPEAVPRRGGLNKRILNERLKALTGYRFRYPSFREGYLPELRTAGVLRAGI